MPDVGVGGWLEPGGPWSLLWTDLIPLVAILAGVLSGGGGMSLH